MVPRYTRRPVKSTVETLEGNKVKLSVEVDEAEFDRDIDAAFRKIAREVRIPGFRPGKAPRRILEARIGLAPAREQALQDAIPGYLADAVKEHDVDVIAPPEIDITAGEEDGPVAFDAVVEVRPHVVVPGYGGLRVELPSVAVSDEDVDERGRRRAAPPRRAERRRPAGRRRRLRHPRHRRPRATASRSPGSPPRTGCTRSAGAGSRAEFDDHLSGATAGDELRVHRRPERHRGAGRLPVAVKKVQKLVLPELTDEWVGDNSASSRPSTSCGPPSASAWTAAG